jgi:hypothetical protein
MYFFSTVLISLPHDRLYLDDALALVPSTDAELLELPSVSKSDNHSMNTSHGLPNK